MKSHLLVPLVALCLPLGANALDPGCTHYEDYLQTFAEIYPDSTVAPEGWYRDLAIKGQYAYSVVSYYSVQAERLQVIDLGNPLDPQFLGFAGLTWRGHLCLEIWDHYVYVGGPGLKVVDVDDETAPVLVNTITSLEEVTDVVAGPGRLYATDVWAGVQTFSLADPENPVLIGTLSPSTSARALALQGDLLAVGGNQAVALYNMSNPSFPSLVGSLDVEGNVGMLEWSGDRLLAGAYTESYLIDTSNPAAPILLGTIPATGAVSAVLEEDVTWVGCENSGRGSLERWDLTDPAVPVRLGRTGCVGVPIGLDRAFGHTYTANWADDYAWVYEAPLVIYTGTAPDTPPHLGQLQIEQFYCSNPAGGMRDNILYLVNELYIEVVDLSDPREMVLGDSVWIGGGYVFGSAGAVVGSNLLVRRWDLINNVYYHDIYSLDDPLHPEHAGSCEAFYAPTVRGNLLYQTTGSGVRVYESLETHRLELLGTLFPGITAGYVVFDGDDAAFLYGEQGIMLGEMVGPVDVVERGLVPSPGSGVWRRPLALEDGLLVCLNSEIGSWEIWDVSDPTMPEFLLSRSVGYSSLLPSRCLLREGFLYIDGPNRLEVWDLTDRDQMEKLGEWPHPSGYVFIHPQPEYLVAQGRYGDITALPLECADMSAAPQVEPRSAALQMNMLAAPNPTHGTTNVAFALAEAAMVEAAVYDLRGQLVRRLANQWMEPGPRNLVWNGRDGRGRWVAAGVYLVRVRAGTQQATERVVLLR